MYVWGACPIGSARVVAAEAFSHHPAVNIKIALDPVWNFSKEFLFETDGASLAQQILTVQCWDWDLIGSDDFIGEVRICLHAVAHGPIHHDLPLRNGSESAGRINFDLICQEYTNTTVKLANLRLLGGAVDSNAFLEFSFAPLEEIARKSIKNQGKATMHQNQGPKPSRLSDMEAHFDVTQFQIHTTYNVRNPLHRSVSDFPNSICSYFVLSCCTKQQSLVSESLYFVLKGSRSATTSSLYNSRGALSLRPFLDGRPFYPHDFSLTLTAPDGSCSLTCHGIVTLTNLPASAQQIGGEHNEYGCTGKQLLPYLQAPITDIELRMDNEAFESQVRRIKQAANWEEVYDVNGSGKREHFNLIAMAPRPQQPADNHFGRLPPPASSVAQTQPK